MRNNTFLLTLAFLVMALFAKAADRHYYTSDKMSSGFVTCLEQDKDGFVWVGTNYGLNRFDGYRFTAYYSKSDDERTLQNNSISTIYTDKSGRLWVGNICGLSLYDPTSDSFKRISLTNDGKSNPHVGSIAENSHGDIFVGTHGFGLYRIDKGSDKAVKTGVYAHDGKDDYYSLIYFDSRERMWVVDNTNSVSCFELKDGKAKLVVNRNSDMGKVMSLVDDRRGGIVMVCQNGVVRYDGTKWNHLSGLGFGVVYNCAFYSLNSHKICIGTNGRGIYQLADDMTLRPTWLSGDNMDILTANITAAIEDRAGNLWAGCGERGLTLIPAGESPFRTMLLSQCGIKNSVITSMCNGDNGDFFFTVSGYGLFKKSVGKAIAEDEGSPKDAVLIYRDSRGRYWLGRDTDLYLYDINSGSSKLQCGFDCVFIRKMTDDGVNAYISTFGKGICILNMDTGEQQILSMFDNDDSKRGKLCNDWVLCLFRDSKGMIWLGTTSGLQCYDPKGHTLKPFGWNSLLDGMVVLSINEDANGNIIVGTNNGLFIYDRRKKQATLFPNSQDLKDLKIDHVLCQRNGDVWCSTAAGIYHYSKQKKQFTPYINGSGLGSHEYLEGIGLTMTNGDIVFGIPEGLTIFNPQSVSKAKNVSLRPLLTNIIVGGEHVNGASLSDGKRIVDEVVADAKSMSVSYLDNTFSLEFSSFDYANIDNVQLEYRLDKDKWTANEEGQNVISFSHLSPGKYLLQVRTNNHGTLSDVTTLQITVRPPWYKSMVAYILYAITIVGLVIVGLQLYHRRKRQEMDEEKMQFLINATHDIRTPLTLILNPLHQLMQGDMSQQPQYKDKLQTINHNANRVLTLVNQILDIRKMDKAQMHLRCRETSLASMVSDVFRVYDYEAHKRSITFAFEHKGDVKAYVDRTQFDKVLTNLLSNAFKYTDDGGEIEVSLSTDEKNAIVEVCDSGVGLKEEDIQRIFKRFYQSSNATVTGVEGTGIGLNLCKMIVDMHHGTISARNRLDKHGSVFHVTVPLGKEHLKPEEIIEEETPTVQTKRPGTGYHVLLVDDDAEITEYISNELSQYYHFTSCRNGKQAIGELLSERKYDLVVSDIMMPEMDGFTLLRLIKTNSNISHVPVILLTSEGAIGNRLEGLEKGADAFLAKPFLLDELRATIDNLIANRLKLKGKFSGAQQQTGRVEQLDITDNDKELMDRIMKCINKNIGDSDFNVEMLCHDVCISRTQLHRKMKELTGLTTSEFIRNIRLEQAGRLLKERHVNVSQVAYTLGFNNVAHFSKVFRQHFGVPPSEYRGEG